MQNQENKEYEATTQWQSRGKTPAGDPFFSVKEARGYYVYGSRGGMDSIAFILYDGDKELFALIHESKPPMDERNGELTRMTTAFGGSCDEDLTFQELTKKEVIEESGYDVPIDRVHHLGNTLVSSQMDQLCELFLVDVTGIPKTHKAEYEVSIDDLTPEQKAKDPKEFIGNEVKWFNANELIENGDWKSITIFTKAIYNDVIIKK